MNQSEAVRTIFPTDQEAFGKLLRDCCKEDGFIHWMIADYSALWEEYQRAKKEAQSYKDKYASMKFANQHLVNENQNLNEALEHLFHHSQALEHNNSNLQHRIHMLERERSNEIDTARRLDQFLENRFPVARALLPYFEEVAMQSDTEQDTISSEQDTEMSQDF